jgi:hypothetical protein
MARSLERRWTRKKFNAHDFGIKILCAVCGLQRDQFHNDSKCEREWLKRIDNEAKGDGSHEIRR